MLIGQDWNPAIHGNYDGGAGGKGVVESFRNDGREVVVYWERSRRKMNLRWGVHFDVKVVQSVKAPDVPGLLSSAILEARSKILNPQSASVQAAQVQQPPPVAASSRPPPSQSTRTPAAQQADKASEIYMTMDEGEKQQMQLIKWLIDQKDVANLTKNLANNSAYVNKPTDKRGSTPLTWACHAGEEGIVDCLLTHGADVNLVEVDGRSPLHYAAGRGFDSIVGKLIEKQANLHATDAVGDTPLHDAVVGGHTAVVKRLIDAGARTDIENSLNKTPVDVCHGSAEMRRLLGAKEPAPAPVSLKAKFKGCLADETCEALRDFLSGEEKERALGQLEEDAECKFGVHELASHDFRDPLACTMMVTMLEETGADFNVITRLSQQTPLIIAVLADKVETVKALLTLVEKGKLDLDRGDRQGRSALFKACGNNSHEIARLLLEKGATVDHKDEDGHTALAISSQEGHIECMKLLLEKGAEVNLASTNGVTPVQRAAVNDRPEAISLLMAHKADINLKDKAGHSALLLASHKGHLECVRRILDSSSGADPNIFDNDGDNALTFATIKESIDVMRLLLTAGTDPNMKNKNSNTVLFRVVHTSAHEALKVLLDSGLANLNQQDQHGDTPLHDAARIGNARAVELLLEYGASTDIGNNRGLTALKSARTDEIKRLLADGGKALREAKQRADKLRKEQEAFENRWNDLIAIQLTCLSACFIL